jgi:alpha-L-arabinofuranosidase
MQATIHVDTHHHVGVIDRRIFGGFLEHLGRAVYEGVFDPGNEHGLSDANGFRTDVLAALKPLGMPVIRYPGGNYVSCHDWQDGIGPRADRPARPDFAWRSVETNQFGTDEFMDWCRALGTTPMMAVNLGTAGAAQAAQLLEYCNLPAGTAWADRRKANGHAEPYGVKLWCLGNEMDGDWQAGHVPADVYAQRARQAAGLMKGLDPSIQTIACGSSDRSLATYLQWDRQVLEHCWDYVDYISAHRYSRNDRQDSGWFLAEGVEIDRILQDYAGLLSYVRGVKRSSRQVYLSFDEWNVWYRARGGAHENGRWQRAPHLLEEAYNLEDALVCAQYLNAFIRRADVVKVACIAQIVNVIAPVMTRPEGLLLQTIYHPMALFSQHLPVGAVSLVPALTGPTYRAGERGVVPMLDASAGYDPGTGTAVAFLVNRGVGTPLTVDLHLDDRTVEEALRVEVLGGADVKLGNTWEQPDQVRPVPGRATLEQGAARVTVPGAGLAVITMATRPR